MTYVLQSSPVVINKSFGYTELGRPATYTLTHTFGLTGTVIIKDNTTSGRQLALPLMAITGFSGTTTLLYDAAAQLVQYQTVNGANYVYTIFDFSQRTDGGAKITYQWNLPSATTGKISMLASKSMAAGPTVAGDGYINSTTGAFCGLGFDWTDILSAYSPTYNGGQVTLTLPASGEIDPSTVGTSTSAGPIPSSFTGRAPVYVPGTGLWWMFWMDGTNVVYSSCATLYGSWAAKATAIAGLADTCWGVCTDGTYIHIAYYASAAIQYIQCTPTSGGSLGASAAVAAVASGVSYCCPSIVVSTDSHVTIGYADTSHYPHVTRNTNLNSSSSFAAGSGFPVTLNTVAYYEPCLAPAPGAYVYAIYGSNSVIKFKTIGNGGAMTGEETASLASIGTYPYNSLFDITVDPSTGITYLIYQDPSYNIKTRARSSGGTWDGAEVTQATTAEREWPAIQDDVATGHVYALWCNHATNCLYYSMWGGSSWGGSTVLDNEASDGGLCQYPMAPLTTMNTWVVTGIFTKTASPYNVKIAAYQIITWVAATGTCAITSTWSGSAIMASPYEVGGNLTITSTWSGTATVTTAAYNGLACNLINGATTGTTYDIKAALVSASVPQELNVCPDNASLVFRQGVLDPLLATYGLNLRTNRLWLSMTWKNILFSGWIKDVTLSGKYYTINIINNASVIAQITYNYANSSTTADAQITGVLGGWGNESPTLPNRTAITGYCANNQTGISIARDMIFANYSAASGSLIQFASDNNGIVQLKAWGTRIMPQPTFSSPQAIGFGASGLVLIKESQKQDTKSYIINDVVVNYQGGSVEVQDATSQTNYGKITRTFNKPNFSNATDATAFGNGILYLYRNPPTYVIATVITNPNNGFPHLGDTYNITDQITLGGTVNGLVCFKTIASYPNGQTEMHLSDVPINILDDTANINSRLMTLENSASVLSTNLNLSGGSSGAIIANNGTQFAPLAAGSNGQILTMASGAPAWVTPSSGGVGGSSLVPDAYAIYLSGGVVYAVNGTTGADDYSGPEASAVINNALGNMSGGGLMFIREGSYTGCLHSLVITSNQKVVGSGAATKLQWVKHLGSGVNPISMSGATNIYLGDMDVDGNYYTSGDQTQANDGINIQNCTNVTIERVSSHNNFEEGIYIGKNTTNGSSYVTVRNCNFSNNWRNGVGVVTGFQILFDNVVCSTNGNNDWDVEANLTGEAFHDISFINCIGQGATGAFTSGGGCGFYISGVDYTTQGNITMVNCQAFNHTKAASCGVTFTGNMSVNTAGSGLSNITVIGGNFSGNTGGGGIELHYNIVGLKIIGISSYSNKFGLYLYTYETSNPYLRRNFAVSACEVYSNSNIGIWVGGSSTSSVYSCLIRDCISYSNAGDGILIDNYTSHTTVGGCRAYSNTTDIVLTTGTGFNNDTGV